MDPITIIGLLASLSSLVDASNSVLKVIKSFRDSERDLLELHGDVFLFSEALRGFDRVLRSRQAKHNISRTAIKRALDGGFATIQELQKKLIQVSDSDAPPVRRMKWVQHKSSFEKLHERLKKQVATLTSFLAIVQTWVTCLPE